MDLHSRSYSNTLIDLSIVFIHGLGGHPYSTWKHPKNDFYWPWELRHDLNHTRVMVFGYNADVKSELAQNFVRIKSVAASLNNTLANKRISPEVGIVSCTQLLAY